MRGRILHGRVRHGRWLWGAVLAIAVIGAACSSEDDTPPPPLDAEGEAAEPIAADATDATADDGAAQRFQLREEERELASRLQEFFPLLDVNARTLDLREFSIALPPDAILAIDQPQFIAQADADGWLDDREPVVVVEIAGEVRAYPLQILTWHEIVNDQFGEVPVAVTFCPLCNSALAFDRRVDGEARLFGVSGLLRRSDLVMFDRTNHSLWQQIGGEALVGADTGTQLQRYSAPIVSYGEFKQTHMDSLVLSRETGARRDYGQNPYVYYDRTSATLFPVPEFEKGALDAKERVLAVEEGGTSIAFPFTVLSEEVVREAELNGRQIVAFWQAGAVSALDDFYILGSRNVGSAGAFEVEADGQRLTFESRDGAIIDSETGSTWNVLGVATAGPLAGTALTPVISGSHFWFAWSVFQPETRVVTPLVAGAS